MEPHEVLLQWATEQGVTLDGIAPKRLPGRGIGIIATRDIQANDLLLEVPTTCLRTLDNIPKSITRKLPKNLSTHGLLAADLALEALSSGSGAGIGGSSEPSSLAREDDEAATISSSSSNSSSSRSKYAAWNAVCPTPSDFRSIPLHWPASLQALLPEPARVLLSKQQRKLDRDWAAVSAAFPLVTRDAYVHAWLLVNTRTFYYDATPRLRRRPAEDRMALQPVADLFNHAADPDCRVAFDAASYVVRADRPLPAGTELSICYGRHSGDLLAVEYGFAMDGNRWDEVGLDEVLLPRLGGGSGGSAAAAATGWRDRLEAKGFLGGYVLDSEQVCYRTQVAVRTLCCGVREWIRFVDGEDDGAASQAAVDKLLVEMLQDYVRVIEERAKEIEGIKEGEECQKELLLERWRQASKLVELTIDRLKKGVHG
ncbi:hypothetical protein BX600DRAFT_306972 [Xylariales sp. PMI_506]|nr:hypothetical protein BX600DRAFT_306972 [Xylariales sp. PMI_506]